MLLLEGARVIPLLLLVTVRKSTPYLLNKIKAIHYKQYY